MVQYCGQELRTAVFEVRNTIDNVTTCVSNNVISDRFWDLRQHLLLIEISMGWIFIKSLILAHRKFYNSRGFVLWCSIRLLRRICIHIFRKISILAPSIELSHEVKFFQAATVIILRHPFSGRYRHKWYDLLISTVLRQTPVYFSKHW